MNSSRIGGFIFLIFSLTYGWTAANIDLDFWSEQETFNARTLPYVLAFCGVLISLAALLQPNRDNWRLPVNLRWRPAVYILLLMSGYGLSLDFLGFPLGSCLLLSIGFYLLGEKRPVFLVAIPLSLVSGFWLLMNFLDIYLDPGLWWHLLFSGGSHA